MKGFLTVALTAAGAVAMMAAGAGADAAGRNFPTNDFSGSNFLLSQPAPGSALANLLAPVNPLVGFPTDPTALPSLSDKNSFLADKPSYMAGDFALAPALHFSFATTSADRFARATDLFDHMSDQSHALLAGLSWNFAKWGSIGLTASHDNYFVMSSDNPNLANVSRVNGDTLGVSAHLGLGGGWVTTASYSEGLTQLDLRSDAFAQSDNLRSQSYTIAIAKHGLFGDDALGFSVSQPALGPANNDLASLVATGDLPPVYAAGQRPSDFAAPETDFQLGYVTSYLNGALALQTNASYQMNVQGQSGTNAVTLLSRAKIKF